MSKLQLLREVLHRRVRILTVGATTAGLVLAAAACSLPSEPGAPERVQPDPAASEPSPPEPAPPAAEKAAERELGWGPQQRDEDAAGRAVAAMSVEQRAGQVLLPFFTGTDHEAHAALVERHHLAGSIIMGDNVPQGAGGDVDAAAMGQVTARLQTAARAGGRTWPGVIAVDQEGGVVARLRSPLTEWPAAMSYGAAGSRQLAVDAGGAMASELAALGFNVDFAPVADVTMGPADPAIGARSFSGDAGTAADFGVAFSEGMLAAGLLPAVKHFPGHGGVSVDSHESLPAQHSTMDQLHGRDLLPFRAAIGAGLPMVMTGHIEVPELEPGVPASLSKASYAALRGMGFNGVAVTDALNMGAVQDHAAAGSSTAPAALAAGADLVLMPDRADTAHAAIITAVHDGTLPPARLAEAARRVVTMMMWHGRTAPVGGLAPGAGGEISRQVSAAAITVLAGNCAGPLVPASVRVTGGSAQDRKRFASAAAEAGLGLGAGPVVALIGPGGSPAAREAAGADVAVALDAPWPLADSPAPAKIALYGRSPGAFTALVAVLTGTAPAPGKLPAAVGTYGAGTGCG